ncbi:MULTISPECIES: NAD(P)-dependent oxidoreductase [unclassified Sphingomonas]|uniref:NAD(P)-dependent oxidoreductase n=1 Tax=unclassified Sphingomonas TaxID=196159 RepID=UPI00226B7216|nr:MULTISPECIES: NAD(P)-dependent oxidoreductase [unclassified Sphingomonas]
MLLIFGLGYTAQRLAARWPAAVIGTSRDGRAGTIAFADEPAVRRALAAASHVLSSVPPVDDHDPVLASYGDALGTQRLAYLSSTGVYGDAGGAWVDETSPTGGGRRSARAAADAAWLARGARVFRLPGIYGPGRSPLDRVRDGRAHRIISAGQVFSRAHVDDLVSGLLAAADAPPGAYNLADDYPAPLNDVVSYAASLLGLPPPPLVAPDQLSATARAFYAENRRVANGKAKRVLGWTPLYPHYRLGLRALNAITSPIPVSSAPAPASGDQR